MQPAEPTRLDARVRCVRVRRGRAHRCAAAVPDAAAWVRAAAECDTCTACWKGVPQRRRSDPAGGECCGAAVTATRAGAWAAPTVQVTCVQLSQTCVPEDAVLIAGGPSCAVTRDGSEAGSSMRVGKTGKPHATAAEMPTSACVVLPGCLSSARGWLAASPVCACGFRRRCVASTSVLALAMPAAASARGATAAAEAPSLPACEGTARACRRGADRHDYPAVDRRLRTACVRARQQRHSVANGGVAPTRTRLRHGRSFVQPAERRDGCAHPAARVRPRRRLAAAPTTGTAATPDARCRMRRFLQRPRA